VERIQIYIFFTVKKKNPDVARNSTTILFKLSKENHGTTSVIMGPEPRKPPSMPDFSVPQSASHLSQLH